MNMKTSTVLEVLLIVVFLVFGFMFVGMTNQLVPDLLPESAQDVDAITYLENFEDPDTADANPDGKTAGGTSIYSYAETDWTWANVTDAYGAPVTGQSYYVNDTDGNGCYSTFTFASKTYTSASFYFMFDDTYHNESLVHLEAANGSDLMYFNITDTKCECYEGDDTLLWSEDIDEGTWYKLNVALNWDGTFTASIYSVSIAGVLTSMGSGTGDMGAGAVSYGSCAIFNVSGVNTQPAGLYIDNMQLYKAGTEGAESRIQATGDSFFILAGVIIFAVVLSILFSVLFVMKKKK